jgi:erythromycin esterase
MARNVEWLAREEHPNEKMVLWAHNGHVQTAAEGGVKSMGAWLRETYGRQMYVLGFAFRRGTLRAVGVEDGRWLGMPSEHTAPPSPEGSGDAVLGAAGWPLFFLHLGDASPGSALARWLAEPHLFLQVGAGWTKDDPEANRQALTLGPMYDGLIFVDEGHAARGLVVVSGAR